MDASNRGASLTEMEGYARVDGRRPRRRQRIRRPSRDNEVGGCGPTVHILPRELAPLTTGLAVTLAPASTPIVLSAAASVPPAEPKLTSIAPPMTATTFDLICPTGSVSPMQGE